MQDTKVLRYRVVLILITAGIIISFIWLLTGITAMEALTTLINFILLLLIFLMG